VHCTAFKLFKSPSLDEILICTKQRTKNFPEYYFQWMAQSPSRKAADYAIVIARKKAENNNAELIALHVIHSEIKHVYSTYSFGGSVNQSSIEGIIEDAKKGGSSMVR
jgi:hypothetical protein